MFLSTCHLPLTRTYQAERPPDVPKVFDFAVDHDNAIYAQTQSACDMSTAESSEPFLSLITSQDVMPAMPSNANIFFDYPEFESFGASLHTPYIDELQAQRAVEFFDLNLPTPLALLLGDLMEDVPDEAAKTRDQDPVQSPSSPPAPMAVQLHGRVATAPSPTPSLSYSVQSTLSSPSPVPIVDNDSITLEEDAELGSPVPASPAHPDKRGASALCEPPTKKRHVSMTPISLSARSARYPCSVPGCKQVCKTLGDLKRHESVLAHKPPSWECSRCHYNFTREDALKRHTKNVSNCASVKARARERAASIKPQCLDAGEEVEAA